MSHFVTKVWISGTFAKWNPFLWFCEGLICRESTVLCFSFIQWQPICLNQTLTLPNQQLP